MAENLQHKFDNAVKKYEGKSGGYRLVNGSCNERYLTNEEWQLFLEEMRRLYKDAYLQYSQGGGGELEETRYPPKMACFGSSSRFIYLLSRGIPGFFFEKRLPTTINGGEANLDGWLNSPRYHIFVEAKCREIYGSLSRERSDVYTPLLRFINSRGTRLRWRECLPCADNSGRAKIKCVFEYNGEKICHFDLMQVICHMLGIGNGLLSGSIKRKEVEFLYLLCDPRKYTSDEKILEIYAKSLLEERAFEEYSRELFGIIVDFLTSVQGVENKSDVTVEEIKKIITFRACNEREYLKEIGMETRYYTVVKIEGEYAYIREEETGEEIFIAMFLLPDGIDVGTKLKYEMLEYEIID